MIHDTAPSISLPFHLIFNSSLSTGIFFSDWKNSKIVPIHKSKTSFLSPSDYRPISLLSLPSKILEHHIFNYLYKFVLLTTSFLIVSLVSDQDSQLKLLYCKFSILGFLHWITKYAVCAVFFHLTKAFDSVPHKPLLDSLSSLDLLPFLLPWLHSYLQGRTHQVIINCSLSSKSQVTSGVHQGSILGLLLFIIYINDIKPFLPSSATLTLYVDDILLFQEISSPTSMSTV